MSSRDLSQLGASPSSYFLRQRIERLVDLQKLYAAIDRDPVIVGAAVVYIDVDYNILTLREFLPLCRTSPLKIVLQEQTAVITAEAYVEQTYESGRPSEVLTEALNMGLACSTVIISGFVFILGGSLTPFSGGASMFLASIGAAGVTASVGQCGLGVARTYWEVTEPSKNDTLDDQLWFTLLVQLLDVVSLLSVVGSSFNTIKTILVRKAATGASWYRLLSPLSRQQRRSLTIEILKLRHPSLSAKQLKLKQRNGQVRKRYTPRELNQATKAMLLETLGGVLGIAGSGSVRALAVSVIQVGED